MSSILPGPKKWCRDTECPYFHKVEVPYSGDLTSEILIVGESPGSQEIVAQRPFIGMSGQLLNAVLDEVGYPRSAVCIANACRCMINKDDDSIKDQNMALRRCRPKLERLIAKVKPRIIVTLGAFALKQLTGKQAILENRGKFFYSEEFGCQIFCTVHPAYVLRGSSREFWKKDASKRSMKENLLYMDFGQVAKFLSENSTSSLDTNEYREGTEADAKQILREAKVVAVDFETTGLDLANPDVKVLSVAICRTEGKPVVYFPENDKFSPTVEAILRSKTITKIVAARPFEERICRQKLGYPMGGKIHDVLVMAHLLDENYKKYTLEAIADIYTPLKGIKSLAEGKRGNLAELPKEKLLLYNAVDADATLRAFNVLRKILRKDERLLRYYAFFTQRIQTMFADTYFNGGLIDAEQLSKDETEISTLMDKLHEEAVALIPPAVKVEHEGKVKLSRNALVSSFLFTHPKGLRLKPSVQFLTPKTKKPQIAEDHLKLFEDKTPFIGIFNRYKKAEKILGTYIKNLWSTIKPDGRIYPDTILTRTVTGRTVMASPTIQTIPTRGEFSPYVKRCFVADPGWSMGARDLAQSEIRVMGWQAGDPNILRALREGIDIHIMTACIVNNIPLDKYLKLEKAIQKDMRQKAKGVNFGFLYGMGAFKFQSYAKNEYGLEFTMDQCEAIRRAFFAYPKGYFKLLEYHRAQEQLAFSHGFVRSPIGRIRRLPGAQSQDEVEKREAFRQAINFPIQSFSSDLGLIGMYLFWRAVKRDPELRGNVKVMWFIHDAVYFQAKDEVFPQAMALLKRCMEVDSTAYIKDKFNVEIGYPIASDGKRGSSWATLKDWEG